ncbi:2-C-methyl-D-erythritol 4-phosphate cytidylyltransferase [Demequina aurantiaca]|uniref:2-C-methyl-D-erythritol 4-phosphate cytidylyltransferase n=1 Tax=Demequina aurantiaca TaxID=676200 RepID=UPI0007866772|nr:2-C-methyl-D-erythritol 4-phosphate cytidylyltransferase [Demequina aurantiaca]
MSTAAVVTAAGSGSRLGADVPKALFPLAGRALVAWAVLRVADACDEIVVTAPATHVADIEVALAAVPELAGRPMLVIPGGAERQQSVAVAIEALFAADRTPPDIVLVHDAARAFQDPHVTHAAIAAVRAGADGAIPVLEVVDTLVEAAGATGELGATVDRDGLRAVQTPQVFRAEALRAAHRDHSTAQATDDAQLVRASGCRVVAVDGHESGFKVTRPSDLPLAEHYANELRATELLASELSVEEKP